MCREGDCDTDAIETEVSVTPGRETPYTDSIPLLRQQIIDLLRRPELSRVDFQSSAVIVNQAAFAARACDLEARRLFVVPRDQTPIGDACYQSVDRAREGVETLAHDTLYVKHDIDLTQVHARALVLHEMVHAIEDAAATEGMVMRVAEAAAYTAQALVFRAFGHVWQDDVVGLRQAADAASAPTPRALARRPFLDALIRLADEIALELLANGTGARIPPPQEQRLYDAIDAVVDYTGHGMDARHFDGIGPPSSTIRGRRRSRR
jgi:hypothetical protein